MGGGGARPAAKPAAVKTPTTPTEGVTKEYPADKPTRMPVFNSPSQLQSARQKRNEIISRSGRASTNMTGNPGTTSYMNSFLGSRN